MGKAKKSKSDEKFYSDDEEEKDEEESDSGGSEGSSSSSSGSSSGKVCFLSLFGSDFVFRDKMFQCCPCGIMPSNYNLYCFG